jgi:hypothetical protein
MRAAQNGLVYGVCRRTGRVKFAGGRLEGANVRMAQAEFWRGPDVTEVLGAARIDASVK